MEFAIELLLSYSSGLRVLANLFGVDGFQQTQEKWYQAHLQETQQISKAQWCNRKVPLLTAQDWFGDTGVINLWPEFVHITLVFINPPPHMKRNEAIRLLKNLFEGGAHQDARLQEAFINVQGLVNVEMPQLRFRSRVVKGEAAGGRSVWQVHSIPAPWVAELQGNLHKILTGLGFSARLPRQLDDASRSLGRVHITIRDERYPSSQAALPAVSRPTHFEVTIEKLAITPAAQGLCRHDTRQKCGATSSISFGLATEVKNSSSQAKATSSQPFDLAAAEFPALGAQRATPEQQFDRDVIQPVFHAEPAAPVDEANDAGIAHMLLHSTLEHAGANEHVLSAGSQHGAHQSKSTQSPNSAGIGGPHVAIGQGNKEVPHDPDDGASHQVIVKEKVYLLRYQFNGMKSGEFEQTLRKSTELSKYLDKHTSSAKVIVYPEQQPAVNDAIKEKQLYPFHIVITESLEPLLEKSLEHIPYKHRPRSRGTSRKCLIDPTESANLGVPVFVTPKFEIKRTFICEASVFRHSAPVTQSTTEATTSRALNPRRFDGPRP